jgi:hypothetical protein
MTVSKEVEMAVRVVYNQHGSASGGATEDVYDDVGQWEVSGGVLVLYEHNSKHVKVAYGSHHWVKAEWFDGRANADD